MSNKPFETIRDGAIKATIWKNDTDKGSFFSVDIVRGYKDDEGNWKDSRSFSGSELLRVSNLATRAYDLILAFRQYDEKDNEPAETGAPSDQFQQNAAEAVQ